MSSAPRDASRTFPSTRWSRILATGDRRDLEELARTYWRPIRAYLAARARVSEEAATDLAQEAFAWMLATNLFDRADPARGRFRGLLKQALANFTIEMARKDAAQKRGGGIAHVPLDLADEPVDAHARTPEQALDDAWRREVLEVARQRLEAELGASGRATYYQLFRAAFLAPEEPDHRTLAQRHGITTTDVSNWLAHAKRRYRAILHAVLVETVSDEAEVLAEEEWLFGPGARRP